MRDAYPRDPVWRYGPADVAGVVELGWWSGGKPPDLRHHFHDDTQISFVFSGVRTFFVEGRSVTVPAGHAIHIPAGMVHASRSLNQAALCVNVYLPEPNPARSLNFFAIRDRWVRNGQLWLQEFLLEWEGFAAHSAPDLAKTGRGSIASVLDADPGRIEEIAAYFGRSREGFTRIAKRELGVAPHAFRVLSRLNRARQMLRDGCPIASVAAETDFADQSHLTRLFRSRFGTTPGLYRRV